MAYHHGDLRRALLRASLDIIAEEGLSKLSLRAAARRAGASAGAPYHHFENRDALLSALAAEGFAALGAHMAESMAAAHRPRERLLAMGVAYATFAVQHPAYFRVMFRPELTGDVISEAHESAARAVMDSLTCTITSAQEAGEIPPGDPRGYVLTAWAAVHGLASLILDGPLGTGFFEELEMPPEALSQLVSETLVSTFTRPVP